MTLLLGGIAGFVIHFYQLGIKALKAGKYILYLLDFFLWVFMILVVSLGMLLINQGALRFYTFVFLILGGVIYSKTLAPRLHRPLQAIARTTANLVNMLANQIMKPGLWLINKIHSKWRDHHSQSPPDDFNL
jgi:hypothetical protein